LRNPERHLAAALLVTVAVVAGCGGEQGAPEPSPPDPARDAEDAAAGAWFRDVADEVGIRFRHESGYRERPLFPEIMGGGVALLDYDGDGALDVYLVQSGTLYESHSDLGRNRLYRNRGDGSFDDVTDGSGADDRGYGMGVAVGDYDNDGDPDLYVTNWDANTLLRNDGGTFTDVTAGAGVGAESWGTSTTFADLDADGDLDLFITNYVEWTVETELDCTDPFGKPDYCSPQNYEAPARDVLYRNEGDGTFTDVSETAGLPAAYGNGLGTCVTDFDGDGRLDIFVANDAMMNQLWINQGGMRFVDDALIRGCAVDEDGFAKAGMGVMAIDYDDDVDRDLIVVNLFRQADSFYVNEGGFFFDYTAQIGLGGVTRHYTRFGIAFEDFDHDGWLDFYAANGRVVNVQKPIREDDVFAEPNVLMKGGPDRKLVEVEPQGGTVLDGIWSSRAAAFGDLDGDGATDIVIANRQGPAQVLHNVVQPRGNGIRFVVRESSGGQALNAVVTARVGDRVFTRDYMSGYSYQAASDPSVRLGLGEAAAVDEVTVRWVDGEVESFGSREAGRTHVLRRGEGSS
jgi:hypothetical protein